MQEQRRAKRIGSLIILGVAILFLLVTTVKNHITAKKAGYKNYEEMQEALLIQEEEEQINKLNQTIVFISDTTINENSWLIEQIKSLGYDVQVISKQNINYNITMDYSLAVTTHQNDANTFIFNGGLITDYLIGSEVGKVGDLLNDSICGNLEKLPYQYQDKNFIMISCPNYTYLDYSIEEMIKEVGNKRNPAEGEENYTFKDYNTFTKMTAKGCGMDYIELYNKTLDKPINITSEIYPEYNKEIQEMIFNELKNILK